MMLNMTEADYESWRDDLRCGGREEYDTQYSAASLYEGGWRSDAISDLIEQFNLTGDEAERIYNERLDGITLGSARVFAPMPERRPPGRQAGLQLQGKERGFRIL